MHASPFFIVDVFAESKYAGNQLAVVMDADGLSGDDMAQIALEMNYSETTFILSDEERDGGYNVRIFTPAGEVPFAGHPTLGTAFIIRQEIIQSPVEKVVLNLKAGQIPVTFNYVEGQTDLLWMRQLAPTFGQTFEPEWVAQTLGLDVDAIDSRYPIQEVSTGLPFIIAPLKNLAAVKEARIHYDSLVDLVEECEADAVLIFSPESYHPQNHLNARMFADLHGVPEDSATGSANGCLAGYLVKHRYFGDDFIDIRVEQGYEIKRPSLLYLRAADKGDSIEVNVGGKVVLAAKGTLV